MIDASDLLLVGRITSVFGIQGWVKVFAYTDPQENIFEYAPWYLQCAADAGQDYEKVTLNDWRRQGKGLIARVNDCHDRDLAKVFTARDIYVPKTALPQLDANEYYWSQLLGLTVINLDGQVLGHIAQMLETGANDVMVVRPTAASIDSRERLLPYLPEQVIRQIDLAAATIEVDWDADF